MKLDIKIKFHLLVVALLTSAFLSLAVSAEEFYVSPQGDDANPGTKSEPFASVVAARDALRESGSLGKEACQVIIASGTYRFAKPLTFSPEDSGTEAAPVVYRAADGAVRDLYRRSAD